MNHFEIIQLLHIDIFSVEVEAISRLMFVFELVTDVMWSDSNVSCNVVSLFFFRLLAVIIGTKCK